ncbi:spore germination lipoprotein GerD [Robertmurraya korlensis]|uniref:spore germination lipoprotein GerD n=1 Tax=Robertmurraya korlensis TaxID=519977 RepID=UPI00203B834A|nr:spore germination lipoprotein GerD [Robertmurraya korlensis]MCM3603362.1 spore germination lipoprotein GerD [Robertmurraya korlensis]
MPKKSLVLPLLISGLLLTGCAEADTASQMDYEETKKMVVDILKTDDGKKAIKDVMNDETMKETLIMDQAVVSDTVEKALTSDQGTAFWKKSFEDPKFSESVAKSMRTENETLLKDLMKDPEYRTMMIDVLKDPELEKEVTAILKSTEYRKHVQAVMTETFESPLFKAKIQDLILKAVEDVAEQSGSKEEAKEEGTGA